MRQKSDNIAKRRAPPPPRGVFISRNRCNLFPGDYAGRCPAQQPALLIKGLIRLRGAWTCLPSSGPPALIQPSWLGLQTESRTCQISYLWPQRRAERIAKDLRKGCAGYCQSSGHWRQVTYYHAKFISFRKSACFECSKQQETIALFQNALNFVKIFKLFIIYLHGSSLADVHHFQPQTCKQSVPYIPLTATSKPPYFTIKKKQQRTTQKVFFPKSPFCSCTHCTIVSVIKKDNCAFFEL